MRENRTVVARPKVFSPFFVRELFEYEREERVGTPRVSAGGMGEVRGDLVVGAEQVRWCGGQGKWSERSEENDRRGLVVVSERRVSVPEKRG